MSFWYATTSIRPGTPKTSKFTPFDKTTLVYFLVDVLGVEVGILSVLVGVDVDL